MKFTAKNLEKEVPKISNLDRELKGRWDGFIRKNLDLYDESDTIKRAVDMFITQLTQRYGEKPQPKSQLSPKVPKKKAEKPKKQKPVKPQFTVNYVGKIPPEVSFIKRYATLHGKKVTSEVKAGALRLLDSLQKAIVEKQIQKTSEYAKEINDIQESLLKMIRNRADGATIDIKSIEQLRSIAGKYRVFDSVKFIKQFLLIQGKENVKEKATKLRNQVADYMKNYSTGRYYRPLSQIDSSLNVYIAGDSPVPQISAQTLSGLYGLAGIDTPEPKSGQAVSAAQFIGSSFDTLPFTGKWRDFIGLPNRNFKIMVYGKAGSGKSTFAIKFADYLASNIGKQVLYVAGEEKFGYTLHEKFVRLNVSSPNLYITDKIPTDLSLYDVVFIDSVNTLGLEPEQLERLPKNKGYVWVFQCTKEGNYRGSQAFEHNADTVIRVEEMKAYTEKNRFGGKVPEMAV